MTEEQYTELCIACDQILTARDSTTDRVAISWLHIIREHPIFLSHYTDLFISDFTFLEYTRRWFRLFRNFASVVRQLFNARLSEDCSSFMEKELSPKVDFFFISHLLNSSLIGKCDDFYFGAVPQQVNSSGNKSIIALIDHTNAAVSLIEEAWRDYEVPRVVLSQRLSFSKTVHLFRNLVLESLRLRREAKKQIKNSLQKRILNRAAQEALTRKSLSNLRIAFQVERLVKILRPKVIVVTHEGHAWERLAFAAARRVNPDIKCIGYQHSAIFKLQHAIRRNLDSKYNPDVILSAGEVGEKQLKASPDLKSISIKTLGTNRLFESKNFSVKTQSAHPWSLLVLPEGDLSECKVLFDISRQCARTFPEIRFIWRLHPLISFKTLFKKNPDLENITANIELSTFQLQEDIMRCKWALYRGTTAIIQAMQAGLRPIYLQLPGEMTIDPLYELQVWRQQVSSIHELGEIIRSDTGCNFESPNNEREKAIQYCQKFFSPFKIEALIGELNSTKRST